MEQMRSEFEKWFRNKYFALNIIGDLDYGHPVVASYFTGWSAAWQASRAAIEIELPARKSAFASGYGDGYLVEQQGGEAIDHDETVEVLRAAGLRVKEK